MSPPPPPVEIDGDIEYEVSKILDSKLDRHFQGNSLLRYLVHWSRYEGTEEETSWVSAQDLEHAQEVVRVFHQGYTYPDTSLPQPTHLLLLCCGVLCVHVHVHVCVII